MSRSVVYTSSPLLASRTPVWRSKLVVAAVALAFVGLAARAAYIQVVANDFFQKQGEVRFARTLDLPANRGRILDRNGLILASSVPAPSIWAIPEDVELKPEELKQLSKLLEIPAAELSRKLADDDKTFVWLKRHMSPTEHTRVQEIMRELHLRNRDGLELIEESRRWYPNRELAAHVVGFVGSDGHGLEGVERAMDELIDLRNDRLQIVVAAGDGAKAALSAFDHLIRTTAPA